MLNIEELIKQSMKEHDAVKTKVYRAIKAEILNYKTAKNAKLYSEEAEIGILKKMVKSHEDSIFMYSEAGRKDLVAEEESELEVLQELIPAAPSPSEIEDFVQIWINQSMDCVENKIPKKLMGSVMNKCKTQFPSANGKTISEIVKKFII